MRRRATQLLIKSLALLLLAGAPAYADEYVRLRGDPDDIAPRGTRRGIHGHPLRSGPGWRIDSETAEQHAANRRRWCREAQDIAARHPGTQLAADLWFGAAVDCLEGDDAARRTEFVRLSERAEQAYIGSDPALPALWIEMARRHLDIGNTEAVTRLMQRLDPWRAVLDGWRDGSAPAPRGTALLTFWNHQYAPVRARWLDATGKLDEAAAVYRHIAEQGPDRGSRRAWRRATEAYARAGNDDETLRAWQNALDAAASDAERAWELRWRLYYRHGLTGATGRPSDPTEPNQWATTDAFKHDLQALLGELAQLDGAASNYLDLGGRAHLAADHETVLDIYAALLDRPDIADVAEAEGLAGTLLVAFVSALELKRFDDAERLLATIQRIDRIEDRVLDNVEALLRTRRIDHQRAVELRAQWNEELKRRKAEAAARKAGASAPPRRRPGLGVPEEGGTEPAPTDEGRGPAGIPLPLLAALVVLLGLVGVVWISRRR